MKVDEGNGRDPLLFLEPEVLEGRGERDVEQRAAADAMEVRVGGVRPVEAGGAPFAGPDLPHDPLVPQEVQVPIDGPKADVGEYPARLTVDGLGGGVLARLPQDVEDDTALPGVSGLLHT